LARQTNDNHDAGLVIFVGAREPGIAQNDMDSRDEVLVLCPARVSAASENIPLILQPKLLEKNYVDQA